MCRPSTALANYRTPTSPVHKSPHTIKPPRNFLRSPPANGIFAVSMKVSPSDAVRALAEPIGTRISDPFFTLEQCLVSPARNIGAGRGGLADPVKDLWYVHLIVTQARNRVGLIMVAVPAMFSPVAVINF